jgi:hypothetical protein
VRKFVTRKYAYLVYYTVDEAAEEIVILNVKHPARTREYEIAQGHNSRDKPSSSKTDDS